MYPKTVLVSGDLFFGKTWSNRYLDGGLVYSTILIEIHAPWDLRGFDGTRILFGTVSYEKLTYQSRMILTRPASGSYESTLGRTKCLEPQISERWGEEEFPGAKRKRPFFSLSLWCWESNFYGQESLVGDADDVVPNKKKREAPTGRGRGPQRAKRTK